MQGQGQAQGQQQHQHQHQQHQQQHQHQHQPASMNLLRRIYGAQSESAAQQGADLMESGRLHETSSSRMEAHAHHNVRDRFQERLAELVPMDWIMNTQREIERLQPRSSPGDGGSGSQPMASQTSSAGDLIMTEVRITGNGSPSDANMELPLLQESRQADLERGSDDFGLPRAANESTSNGSPRVDMYPAIHSFARWLESAFPFTLLLICVFIYEHSRGILVFLWLSIFLSQANEIMRKQVSLKENRNLHVLSFLVWFIVVQAYAVYFLFGTESLWRNFVFLSFSFDQKEVLGFFDLLWIVTLDDLLARHAGMLIKAISLMVVGGSVQHQRTSQLMNVEECLVSLYRDLIPIPIWLQFLTHWPTGLYLPGVVRGCYLTLKLTSVVDKIQCLRSAIQAFIFHQTPYGRYVRADELTGDPQEDICTICHDPLSSPVRVRCGHIFCEECVHQWLQRERTCPLCRSIVRNARQRLRTDGSTSILPVIF
ncbi:hypothetical protein GUITHDRAFT_155451 [Guillardia theta CCMP2712]|uniref:RING-type domain-containing protein n=2 Tax=Guillardia theta TaxID=55529 RepID=L1IH50_GUITC|nr:hypothetical protein GUITHDRAFT_155451 [Guillardia theta CCMP2712]EKX35563.1 hypothetical protein GUITHDRAFT_155451 [Guillardia theta CCMP2712]|eukprot:XP_005822543.1 hypothetical protein GUITHDRAFT_155451 [Guillardia theta CCMP2712]